MLSDCIHFSGQISACFEECISGEEIAELKQHLETCGTCSDYMNLYRSLMHVWERYYVSKQQIQHRQLRAS